MLVAYTGSLRGNTCHDALDVRCLRSAASLGAASSEALAESQYPPRCWACWLSSLGTRHRYMFPKAASTWGDSQQSSQQGASRNGVSAYHSETKARVRVIGPGHTQACQAANTDFVSIAAKPRSVKPRDGAACCGSDCSERGRVSVDGKLAQKPEVLGTSAAMVPRGD